MKRSKQILVKAITRAEFESLPAVVRYFSPPFDVLAADHYEPPPEQPPPRYTADELLNYFDGVSLWGESKKAKPREALQRKKNKPADPNPSQPQPRPAAQSVTG